MTTGELIELLSQEEPDIPVFIWVAAEHGQQIVKIGICDQLIGRSESEGRSFLLLPVELQMEDFEAWEGEEPN